MSAEAVDNNCESTGCQAYFYIREVQFVVESGECVGVDRLLRFGGVDEVGEGGWCVVLHGFDGVLEFDLRKDFVVFI